MFYDVILVYSVCSIVLRVRNKGDDDECRRIWEWTQVEHIGPMIHQGDHFDAGLSRDNFWGFRGVRLNINFCIAG